RAGPRASRRQERAHGLSGHAGRGAHTHDEAGRSRQERGGGCGGAALCRLRPEIRIRSRTPRSIPSRHVSHSEGQMTVNIPITIACGDYDCTRAIKDGRVPVEGCDFTYIPLEPDEVFFRAFRYQEFDVCELSFSSYLRVTDNGTSPYIGIPAFVSRIFRHSGI